MRSGRNGADWIGGERIEPDWQEWLRSGADWIGSARNVMAGLARNGRDRSVTARNGGAGKADPGLAKNGWDRIGRKGEDRQRVEAHGLARQERRPMDWLGSERLG